MKILIGILIVIAILISMLINNISELIAYFIDNKYRKKSKSGKYGK